MAVIGLPIAIIALYFGFSQAIHSLQQEDKKRRFIITTATLVILSIIILILFFFHKEIRYFFISDKGLITKPTTIDNLLTCLGDTGGKQRYTKLSGCLDGVSLPTTTTADQILSILGTIPINTDERRTALVKILRNSKITISGNDATRLLRAFSADLKKLALFDISCHIKRPIPDSDKNELLTGIDPMWQVRQELEKYQTPPCEKRL